MSDFDPTEALRKVVRDWHRSGYEIRWFTPVEHSDSCDCDIADGYTVEEVGERCAEVGEEYPMLVRDDGQYVTWAMRLDQLTKVLDDYEYDVGDGQVEIHVNGEGDVFHVVKSSQPLPVAYEANDDV